MAIRREDSASKLQDFQIGSSWIPATPTKPGPPSQLSIDTNQSVRSTLADWTAQANVSESESITENFLQEFDSWQAREGANSRVYGEKSCIYNNFPINAAEQWTNMPFGKLLALAEANVGNKTAIENTLTHHFATSSSSASYFHQQTEGGQFTVSIGDSSERDQCSLLAANFDAESKISDFVSNGSSTPWNFFNLDSPPRTIAGAALAKSALSQVEPVTPEKTNKESVMKDTSIEEVPANKENEVTTGVMELHEKKDTNQLCEATSTKLQENHKPDKGVSEEASLSKTPQQKTRRKKHRPKVIIEGQQRRTPKSSAEKPSVAQKTTRAKRNYVRKNGANTPVGVANGTDLDTKTPSSLETPGKKRKYTRKIINKPEDNMDKGTPETTDMKTPQQHSQRSCRRSLNFDSDGQMRDGSSTYFPSPNCDKVSQAENFDAKDQPRATPCMQEMGVVLRKDDMVTSHEVSNSMNQVHEEYLPMPEQHYQSSLPSANKNHMLTDQIVCARGKCQILFSDVTHDKEPRVVQVTMNPYSQLMFGSLGDSICSSPCLTPEKQVRGLKRQSACTTVEAELCSRNETGIFYNSLQAYRTILFQNADKISGTSGLHFPVIYKKKRTDKEHNTVTSSIQIKVSTSDNHACVDKQSLKYSCTKLCTSAINQGLCGARGQVNNLLTNATNGTQNGRQVFEDLLALGPTPRIRKRKSKGPTRVRKIASLLEELPAFPSKAATARIKQDIEIQHQPYTCMGALVADTHSTTITKKRSKRSMLNNSTVQHMYSYHKFSSMSMGPPLALTWKSMSPVDSIIDQLNGLDLNAESSRASERKCNALMSCCRYYQEPHDIVPFQNSSAVVPFDISFDQVRRRRQRPIVDLDDETTRVWNLLLENINSEGIDGTDEEKTKWWEEERRVFRGRTDSFIARMHLIQGDRRFSPWKGSVVDSVVGVFLTQNVSDHLSSSAFMSLAARYPLKSKINQPELHEEGLGTIINEPKVCVLESNGTFGLNREILHQSVCGEDTKMLQNIEDDGIREVNSIKPSGKAIGGIILKDNLRGQSNDNPGHGGPDTSCEISTNKSLSLIEDGRDIEDTLSSQNSANSPITQTTERTDSCLMSTTEEPTVGVKPNRPTNSGSFVKLLQMAGTVLHGVYGRGSEKRKSDESQHAESESLASDWQAEDHLGNSIFPAKVIASYTQSGLCHVPNSGVKATDFDSSQRKNKFSDSSSYKELCTAEISELSSESACGTTFQKITAVGYEEVQKISSPNAHCSSNEQIEINKIIVGNQTGQALAQNKMQGISKTSTHPQSLIDATGSTSNIDISKNLEHKGVNSNKNDHPGNMVNGPKAKGGRPKKEKGNQGDWDHLRKQTRVNGRERARTANTLDSVDWEAIRCADVNEIAETIKERGMNNVLAERIKDFLDRLVRDHGSIDLEWLRDVPPDKAKEYLLSIRGLGLKSVECVRLLTLHHLAFPVDTNVGRIAVRLGWVPLQPLPESLQLHLLELYPVLESIQKYLWPRLCKLDQRTLYELHYQMITFGKVFCTKSKPNCNACPMRGECRHFASAFASARLALPAPEDKSIVSATVNRKADQNPIRSMSTLQLPSSQAKEMDPKSGLSNCQPIIEEPSTPEPIIEMPATPEPDLTQVPECDIESAFCEDPDEIPTIQLNMEEFTHNLQTFMQQNSELQEGDMSKALVALTSAAASIPVPKLKNVSRLRTEHQVYELPDSHPLLDGMDKREPDDPCPYLLAIWTPGETMNSIEPPERRCISQEFEGLCSDETCLSCNSIREVNSQTVRGTLLIPCRTAMRGSFPLNGTYFQVNEVFSDHESSLSPIDVPRKWLWNLPRRTVYFGTSIPTIFKGLSTEGIQYCFWRGFVCVRGFDRETRAPRPLIARLHFPASKLAKGKGKIDEDHR